MTKVNIDPLYCKGCDICLSICKKNLFSKSKKRNNYGTSLPEVVDPEACIECRICERMCPDGAIEVDVKSSGRNK